MIYASQQYTQCECVCDWVNEWMCVCLCVHVVTAASYLAFDELQVLRVRFNNFIAHDVT